MTLATVLRQSEHCSSYIAVTQVPDCRAPRDGAARLILAQSMLCPGEDEQSIPAANGDKRASAIRAGAHPGYLALCRRSKNGATILMANPGRIEPLHRLTPSRRNQAPGHSRSDTVARSTSFTQCVRDTARVHAHQIWAPNESDELLRLAVQVGGIGIYETDF